MTTPDNTPTTCRTCARLAWRWPPNTVPNIRRIPPRYAWRGDVNITCTAERTIPPGGRGLDTEHDCGGHKPVEADRPNTIQGFAP